MPKKIIYAEDAIKALTEVESHYEFEEGHDHLLRWAKNKITALPSAQPQLDAEFAEAVRAMFANIWDCRIEHQKYKNTVGEILEKVIELHNFPPMK